SPPRVDGAQHRSTPPVGATAAGARSLRPPHFRPVPSGPSPSVSSSAALGGGRTPPHRPAGAAPQTPERLGFNLQIMKDIDSYRSRKRKKGDFDQKFRMLEERVAALEARMSRQNEELACEVKEVVPRQVKLALKRIQESTGTADRNVTVSHAQPRSSCGSTGEVPSLQDNMQCLPVPEPERYPVDEITQRTPCELHTPSPPQPQKLSVPRPPSLPQKSSASPQSEASFCC
ncbi:unnamed protein product, partial [Urochloa humidicola]